jgi:hypothetical protein
MTLCREGSLAAGQMAWQFDSRIDWDGPGHRPRPGRRARVATTRQRPEAIQPAARPRAATGWGSRRGP